MNEAFDLSDEQRVTLFIALRLTNPGLLEPRRVTHLDIEDNCRQFWGAIGVHRSNETWSRAFRRAKREGLLGHVTQSRVRGKRYDQYQFDGSLEDILVAVGPGYQMIPHGRRRSRRSARKGARQ